MSRAQKKKVPSPVEPAKASDPAERMRALYGQGATGEARTLAALVLADPGVPEEARELARRLDRASSIDPRALLIAGLAAGLAALYTIRFLLLG